MSDLDAIKARLAAVHTAGASGITVRLADHGIRAIVQMQSWEGNTAHEANAAVTHLLGHAPADLTALVAEVERLRGKSVCDDALRERAAVVAYLLRDYDTDDSRDRAAEAIQNGEHRREEDK